MLLSLVPCGKILGSFLCYVIFCPCKRYLEKMCALDTFYWLIEVELGYLVFWFIEKFLFALPWSKISHCVLKLLLVFLDSRNLEKKIIKICFIVSHWGVALRRIISWYHTSCSQLVTEVIDVQDDCLPLIIAVVITDSWNFGVRYCFQEQEHWVFF